MTEQIWRNLALQFDDQRMLALAHLRRALDTGLQNRQEIELFLQSSPRSGNEISAVDLELIKLIRREAEMIKCNATLPGRVKISADRILAALAKK
jgi:hypothetical protein